ncbi:MAG: zinc-dependent alcohol dehydrogenase family protein [Acidobacteria bacterium]|nr:zinc-dependent alcohol dehydrogenase family protein [Acidobacteriota bacterium]
MQAYVLGAAGRVEDRPLRLLRVRIPRAETDEVLVRVTACGICRTDLHICEGDLERRREHIIPGHQVVGRIAGCGTSAGKFAIGERVGIAWLGKTCGRCRFCIGGKENLCDAPEFNGWTRDGGFAEYVAIPENFVYRIPDSFTDIEAAPLLCAGIIGYRALRLTGIDRDSWAGARLGIYGFGAAGHIAIQIARKRGAEVYVATRDRERHQALAVELGAVWIGDTFERPPVELDAAIVFAPAGEIVPAALGALGKGGSLVLGGIHMSPIPEFEYKLIYGERIVRSVANNTRADGEEFLNEAAQAGVRTHTQVFGFEELPEALIALKHDAIRGAAVLEVDETPARFPTSPN